MACSLVDLLPYWTKPAERYPVVMQSLTLWREISHDMFQLWCTCDDDLLREGNYYRLSNTGQGLNRVQQAPKVLNLMHNILARCQRRIGNWVGSSVIHLGDHNVPNALMLIDKYTQVGCSSFSFFISFHAPQIRVFGRARRFCPNQDG